MKSCIAPTFLPTDKYTYQRTRRKKSCQKIAKLTTIFCNNVHCTRHRERKKKQFGDEDRCYKRYRQYEASLYLPMLVDEAPLNLIGRHSEYAAYSIPLTFRVCGFLLLFFTNNQTKMIATKSGLLTVCLSSVVKYITKHSWILTRYMIYFMVYYVCFMQSNEIRQKGKREDLESIGKINSISASLLFFSPFVSVCLHVSLYLPFFLSMSILLFIH